jgi:hypothetical protein
VARDLIILNSRRTLFGGFWYAISGKWVECRVWFWYHFFFVWRNRRTKTYPIEIQTSSFDAHKKRDMFLFLSTHKMFVEYEWVIAPRILRTVIYVCLWSAGLFYSEWGSPKAPRIGSLLALRTHCTWKEDSYFAFAGNRILAVKLVYCVHWSTPAPLRVAILFFANVFDSRISKNGWISILNFTFQTLMEGVRFQN